LKLRQAGHCFTASSSGIGCAGSFGRVNYWRLKLEQSL
jgi:hypothetical protein